MGHIPKDVEWFLAEIVLEIKVEGDSRNVVHNNWTLVRAHTAEEAYERAVQLGKGQESEYLNPKGKRVQLTFRGLRELDCIDNPLEHGGEVTFQETVGVTEPEIRKMVKPKAGLKVFKPLRPHKRRSGPDYAAGYIIEALESAGFRRPGTGKKKNS